MSRSSLSTPALRHDETVVGWSWYAFQMIVLPSLLTSLNGLLKRPFSTAEVNFTYFIINFLATLWIYHRFLGSSFQSLRAHPALFCQAVVLGLAADLSLFSEMIFCLHLLDPGYVNQNDASIAAMTRGSYYLMLLGTVILAPVAEECVFRGLLFRNLWKVNMGAAYAVSMAAFSVIHIVNYVGVYSPLRLLLAFLQYLPAGLCLSWCYTKSGSIYGPIVMHSLINLYSLNLLR